jgi:hypothetical protein
VSRNAVRIHNARREDLGALSTAADRLIAGSKPTKTGSRTPTEARRARRQQAARRRLWAVVRHDLAEERRCFMADISDADVEARIRELRKRTTGEVA